MDPNIGAAIIAAATGALLWFLERRERRRLEGSIQHLESTTEAKLLEATTRAEARDAGWRRMLTTTATYTVGTKSVVFTLDENGNGRCETAYYDVTPAHETLATIQIPWRMRLDSPDAAVTSVDTMSEPPWTPIEILDPPAPDSQYFVCMLIIRGPLSSTRSIQFKYAYDFVRCFARYREELTDFGSRPGTFLEQCSHKVTGFATPTVTYEMWLHLPSLWWRDKEIWKHISVYPLVYPMWEDDRPLTDEMAKLEQNGFQLLTPDKHPVDRPTAHLTVTADEDYLHPLKMYGIAWTPPPRSSLESKASSLTPT